MKAKLARLLLGRRHGAAEGPLATNAPKVRVATSENRAIVQASGLFDSQWYLKHNPDVEGIDPLVHYLEYGGFEGRAAGPDFDSAWYLGHYHDVAKNGINPLVHYIQYGLAEGRHAVPVRARANSQADRAMVEVSGLFDPAWYVARYPDVADHAGLDVLEHYLVHGGFEGRASSPKFDAGWYSGQYPDVAESGLNPLVHYLQHGAKLGRQTRVSESTVKTLQSALDDLVAFEPDIAREPAFADLSQLPCNYSLSNLRVAKAWRNIFASTHRDYDHIIFVPWLIKGGADLVAANAARSVIDEHGDHSVLIVLSDYALKETVSWLPPSADVLSISDFEPALRHEERVEIVRTLLFALRPRSILCVNSHACWDTIKIWGKYFSGIIEIYGMLFCQDFDEKGRPGGYSDTHFRACLPHLKKVYFDNETFMKQLVTSLDLPGSLRERLQVLPQPVSPQITQRDFMSGSSAPILWSGRFSRQKNIDLLSDIITRAPHLTFHIFGEGEGAYAEKLKLLQERVSNMELKGAFPSIESLPTEQYGAYLFTSLWEGMPTTLINVSARGIPVVAPNVGGIQELVTNETGWLIDDPNDTSAFLDALDDIRNNPDEAMRRVERMVEHVRDRYSWTAYTKALKFEPSFLD